MKKTVIIILLTFLFSIYLKSQTNKKEEYIKAVREKIEQIKATISSSKKPLKEYIQIAHLYLDIEDYNAAEEYFLKSLMLEPDNPNIHYMLAMLYEKKGDKIKAIESWKYVIKHSKNKKITEIAQKHIEILSSDLESNKK